MQEVKEHFRKIFGVPPVSVVRAPGRLELLGNHTDYNEGLVMSIAVDRYIFMAASTRNDGQIELASTAYPEKHKFTISELSSNPDFAWADYVKGVLSELNKRGIHFSGFNAAIHGTVPMGAGMSSSAALEVATALTVRQLYPYAVTNAGWSVLPREKRGELEALSPIEKLEIAKLCQAAENNFVGVKSGLLDQISSLFGKAFHAIEIDCKHLTVNHAPVIAEVAIVVCNSGVKHSLVGGEYNELREKCEEAARALGVSSLRAVDMNMLKANKQKLTERQYQCAYHIVGEIQRVAYGEKALKRDDFAEFGTYMFQSHESSRDYFKNSTPELDMLVDLAKEHPACLGARLTGGGFGGATINLVNRIQVEKFMAYMADGYTKKSGHQMTPLLCQVVDGAA